MFRKRLIISFLLVFIGLGLVVVLPQSFELQPAAVNKAFPNNVADWIGQEVEPEEREKKVLAELVDAHRPHRRTQEAA